MDGVRPRMDFYFESAAWIPCSTRFADNTFVITHGGYTKYVFLSDKADELR